MPINVDVNRESSIVNTTLRYKNIRIDWNRTLLDSNILIIGCGIHD